MIPSSNPPASKVKRIADEQPVFPCWLWGQLNIIYPSSVSHWRKSSDTPHAGLQYLPGRPDDKNRPGTFLATHWHPDQPEAPKEVPDAYPDDCPISAQQVVAPADLPAPASEFGSNGGVKCDTDKGPCACGAWHTLKPDTSPDAITALLSEKCNALGISFEHGLRKLAGLDAAPADSEGKDLAELVSEAASAIEHGEEHSGEYTAALIKRLRWAASGLLIGAAHPTTDEAIAGEIAKELSKQPAGPFFEKAAQAVILRALQRALPPTSPEQEREDKELLNAVINNKWTVMFNSRIDRWTVQGYQQVVGCIAQGDDTRSAIRAAIAARPSQQQGAGT